MSDEIITVAGSHLRGFRGVAGESHLRPRIVSQDTSTRYYQRVRDDGFIKSVTVWHPVGEIVCFTTAANGDHQRWGCRETGVDEITFFAHPGYVHTTPCVDCDGAGVVNVDPLTNPLGSRCGPCEGSGALPRPVCLVFEKQVAAERLYLEPTKIFSFLESR